MSSIRAITEDRFHEFANKLKVAQTDYLPMLYGTLTESAKQTAWAEKFDESRFWVIDEFNDSHCLWTLRKGLEEHPYLWIDLMLPSDWNRRFEIVEMSLPNLIDWYWKQEPYQCLEREVDWRFPEPGRKPFAAPEISATC